MKVAILLPTWLGDTCMSTPTIRAIRQGMPEIDELCVVGRYAPVEVLSGLPWVDSTLIYKPRSKSRTTFSRRGVVAALKARRFDMMVLLPNSLSAGLIGYLSGAKQRVGFAKDGRTLLLTHPIPLQDKMVDHRKEPAIDYYLNIAKHLGCDTSDRRMQLFVSESERELARSLYSKIGFDWGSETVVFNTSSAAAASKLWPVGHASRAAKELASKHGTQVIVHCGPADRERANAIAFGANHPLVKSMGLEDDIPIGLSKAIIERASVVVSTDSGPRHMAVAMNKKVISLFGSMDPEITRTYNVPETVLRVPMACQPCGKQTCPLVHTNCMHALTYPMVVNAVAEQLAPPRHNSIEPSLASALARNAA